jgi:hypothetical protein
MSKMHIFVGRRCNYVILVLFHPKVNFTNIWSLSYKTFYDRNLLQYCQKIALQYYKTQIYDLIIAIRQHRRNTTKWFLSNIIKHVDLRSATVLTQYDGSVAM